MSFARFRTHHTLHSSRSASSEIPTPGSCRSIFRESQSRRSQITSSNFRASLLIQTDLDNARGSHVHPCTPTFRLRWVRWSFGTSTNSDSQIFTLISITRSTSLSKSRVWGCGPTIHRSSSKISTSTGNYWSLGRRWDWVFTTIAASPGIFTSTWWSRRSRDSIDLRERTRKTPGFYRSTRTHKMSTETQTVLWDSA